MSDNSGIEWTDATWNPVTGCDEVSPGCDHCYAKKFAERWRGTPGHYFERGFDVQLRPDKLSLPLSWRKPRKVFVNSMSDLFHKDVPDEYIARVFAVMAACPQHTFQVLTKRHARMHSLLNNRKWRDSIFLRESVIPGPERPLPSWPLGNVWLGVSAEDQKWADIRIPVLLETPAAVRWISAEPLLGPINLTPWIFGKAWATTALGSGGYGGSTISFEPSPLDWVVVGGESGPGARPMHPDWARSLRDQCAYADVPFLFKQFGAHNAEGKRVGKGAAGRVLDGRTHDEYPKAVAA